MVKFNYALNSDNYDVKNALLWGNFNGHVEKAKTGTLGNKVVHAMIAAVELLPVVSQIASLIECFVVKVFSEKSQSGNAVTATTGRVAEETGPIKLDMDFSPKVAGRGIIMRNEELSTLGFNGDTTVTACYNLRLESSKGVFKKYVTFTNLQEMKDAFKKKVIQTLDSSQYKEPVTGDLTPDDESFKARREKFANEIADLLQMKNFQINGYSSTDGYVYEVNGYMERHGSDELRLEFVLNIQVAFFSID